MSIVGVYFDGVAMVLFTRKVSLKKVPCFTDFETNGKTECQSLNKSEISVLGYFNGLYSIQLI